MNRDGFPAGGIQKCINPEHLFVFFHSIILIVFIISVQKQEFNPVWEKSTGLVFKT
jgi:hypothetical protein